jgi:hypothetical protein
MHLQASSNTSPPIFYILICVRRWLNSSSACIDASGNFLTLREAIAEHVYRLMDVQNTELLLKVCRSSFVYQVMREAIAEHVYRMMDCVKTDGSECVQTEGCEHVYRLTDCVQTDGCEHVHRLMDCVLTDGCEHVHRLMDCEQTEDVSMCTD